jgi:two-component sensor histidine kinase/putative methionine-R-sulfoxide reductase with GAF domain
MSLSSETPTAPLYPLLDSFRDLELVPEDLIGWMDLEAALIRLTVRWAHADKDLEALLRRVAALADSLASTYGRHRWAAELSHKLLPKLAQIYVDAKVSVVPRAEIATPAVGPQIGIESSMLSALHRINSALNSSLNLQQMLDTAAEAVAQVMRGEVCSIFLYDQVTDQLILRATNGLNRQLIGKFSLRLGEGITGTAALTGRPQAVTDAWADRRFVYCPDLHEERYRSLLAVPIILYTVGKLVGVIDIHTADYRDFGSSEVQFLELVAGELAMAIENAQLYQATDERLRRKVAELSTLQRVSAMVASTLDLESVLSIITSQALFLARVDAVAIYQLAGPHQVLKLLAIHGSDEGVGLIDHPIAERAIRNAVATARPVLIKNLDRISAEAADVAPANAYRTLVCIPMPGHRGILGALSFYDRDYREFDEEELALYSAFAHQAAIAIQNAHLYEEAQRALEVKSVLLKEMHHRVRNNLQTVAALLSLQKRRCEDTPSAEILGESIARIESIAAVHDLLCGAELGHTTLEALARQVVESVLAHHVAPDQRIEFEISAPGVMVGSREATLLAIIINELVSNAVRHGFAGRKHGRIQIRAHGENGHVVLSVVDDGHGYPDNPQITASPGLGMGIVRTLVKQDLGGSFKVERRDGTTVATVAFRQGGHDA